MAAFTGPDEQADLCLNTRTAVGLFFYVVAAHAPR
jgi:hypothetical protein